MSIAFTAAVFAWFGLAIGAYTGVGATTGVIALLVLAPLQQPQLIVFALVRHWVGRRHGPVLRALAGAAAWVACEWLWPKLLGDSLGHGLYPSPLLRQFADIAGVAGITFLLVLANEAVAAVIRVRRDGARAWAMPLAALVVILVSMTGYGVLRLSSLHAAADDEGTTLRIGMVQSNIYDYERLRREMGAYEVVRHVLDTHYALSREAIKQHGVDALLWSETVYPTTFGHPKSEDGAALDREIQAFVASAGVPLVFGTYDLDEHGEYNAAAFIDAGGSLLGFYRKTDPFPLTEHVPRWLDRPLLRRVLPWAGTWQPGDGARVFPLRTRDGREVPALPLICLDDVDTGLARDGARLGAQLILTMSNDSWFTDHPAGANLHLAVAAFRSIETRLPQLRVTANGISAVVDASGAVTAATPMGERALLVGEVRVREPPATLLVAWGDWFGRACLGFLAVLALLATSAGWRSRTVRRVDVAPGSARKPGQAFQVDVVLLSLRWQITLAALKLVARGSLLWFGLGLLWQDPAQLNSLARIWAFMGLVVAPELAAWCISRLFAAKALIADGLLRLEQRERRIEITVADITGIAPWRLPWPAAGAWLQLAAGQRWSNGIAIADPVAFAQALVAAGAAPAVLDAMHGRTMRYAQACARARRRWLDQPLVKFVLFPLVPALPAFRLHQHIAFGGTFGEYQTYGLKAYLVAFAIWWASWAIGLVLFAAVLRVGIELGTMVALLLKAERVDEVRQSMEMIGRLLFYVVVPAWLLLRIWAG